VQAPCLERTYLIDHVLDQVEPPAADRLLAGQLDCKVRRLPFGGGPAVSLVGYTHGQRLGRGQHADEDGTLALVLVAVLHRVEHRLCHRRVQLVDARCGQAHVACDRRDPVGCWTLHAGFARQAELVEQRPACFLLLSCSLRPYALVS